MNAKILAHIIGARQVDIRSRKTLVKTIKVGESLSQNRQVALLRSGMHRQSEIARSNQKLAIKLFTQKPTYQVMKFEKDYINRQVAV